MSQESKSIMSKFTITSRAAVIAAVAPRPYAVVAMRSERPAVDT